MATMLAKKNFFQGLDPASIATVLKNDPFISSRVTHLQAAQPWLWHMSLSKTYLVYAMTFSRTYPGS